MNIILLTPPTDEPVTLAEVKEYLRVTHSHEDATIARMARASRVQCENMSRRSFITQQRRLELTIPTWHSHDSLGFAGDAHDPDAIAPGIRIPMRDVKEITAFNAVAADGSLQSIANDHYDFEEGASTMRWSPTFWRETSGFPIVRIDYTAGQTVEEFAVQYADLVDAILMLTDFKYNNRAGDKTIPHEIRTVLLNHWTSVTYSA